MWFRIYTHIIMAKPLDSGIWQQIFVYAIEVDASASDALETTIPQTTAARLQEVGRQVNDDDRHTTYHGNNLLWPPPPVHHPRGSGSLVPRLYKPGNEATMLASLLPSGRCIHAQHMMWPRTSWVRANTAWPNLIFSHNIFGVGAEYAPRRYTHTWLTFRWEVLQSCLQKQW